MCSEEKTKNRVIFNRQRYQPKQMPKAQMHQSPTPYHSNFGQSHGHGKICPRPPSPFLFPEHQGGNNQGTMGCTPNSVPMVFIVFSRDSWG